MRIHWILAALVAIAACDAPPPAPSLTLQPGADSLRLTIREATDGVWLGGERFAILSPADNAVAVVDFASDSVVTLDSTSGEIERPSGLFVLGDTLFIQDWARRRVSAWIDGEVVRSIPASDAARGALPQAIDTQGRLYYELSPRPRRDGSGNRDSAAVLRASGPTATPDTAARLGPLDIAEVQSDQGRRFERRILSGDDEWGVLPDGSIWIARTYQNRVDWLDSSGVEEGERLRDRVLEVTRVDRERFVQRFPPELRTSAERLPFSPIKPPFVRGFTGGGGDVWLEKSRAVSDTGQLYHQVGRDGNLVREVRVDGWARILAVSPDAALVVLPDSLGMTVIRSPM